MGFRQQIRCFGAFCRLLTSAYNWGGGIEVRNLPQFTAILPQSFSDASIQKFQFSPEEKIFSLFAVTRHTVRFCVLICPAYHLCGRTIFCFCVPKMSSTSGDRNSGKGKRPVKFGKGQGGQKARYATQMTPAARAPQYPDERFTVKQTDAEERLWTVTSTCAAIANWVRNWSKKPFCKKSGAPLLLMAGIECGDQKEMYRNVYRNFTAIYRNFPQFYRNFFRLGGPQSPPAPATTPLASPKSKHVPR